MSFDELLGAMWFAFLIGVYSWVGMFSDKLIFHFIGVIGLFSLIFLIGIAKRKTTKIMPDYEELSWMKMD